MYLQSHAYNRSMSWLRNLLVPILLITLIAGAYATSINMTFGKPDHVKQWLSESGTYEHLINYGVEQATKAAGDTEQANSVASDPQVIQVVKTSFPPELLESSVNTFLDGNYAWLQGKTEQPDFSIDLEPAKQNLAAGLANYAGNRFVTLPACSPDEVAQFQGQSLEGMDLLSLTCQPPGVSQQAVMDQLSRQILNSGDILNNPTLTPESISQNVSEAANASEPGSQPASEPPQQPYYQSFSMAPAMYKFGMITPWVALLVALASAAGIVFWSATKRKGLKLAGIIFALAGLWLIATKFMLDSAFNSLEQKVTDASVSGQLQAAFTEVAHNAEKMLTKIDLWFGLVFLVIAAVIFAYLFFTREQKPSTPATTPDEPAVDMPKPEPAVRPKLRKPPKPPTLVQ